MTWAARLIEQHFDEVFFLRGEAATIHVVRKVSAAGMIIRVADTGIVGNADDDGSATDAQLHQPTGVAVTPDGGFLIADGRNNEVCNVSAG
jgi:NHL repeat